MPNLSFTEIFEALTESAPFPWQNALFESCAAAEFPTAANIPTGLGKTSIAAIWLMALAKHSDRGPRRPNVQRSKPVLLPHTELLRCGPLSGEMIGPM